MNKIPELIRKNRFVLSAAKSTQLKSMTASISLDLHGKTVELEVYDTEDGETQKWVESFLKDSSEEKLTLELFNGVGLNICTFTCENLVPLTHELAFDYASTDMAKHCLLIYCGKITRSTI